MPPVSSADVALAASMNVLLSMSPDIPSTISVNAVSAAHVPSPARLFQSRSGASYSSSAAR